MTTGRTRRAVDARGAQGGSHASRRAAPPCPHAPPCCCSRPARRRPRSPTTTPATRLRRPDAGAARPAVGRAARLLPAGPRRRRADGQLADAAHPQRRRAAGPRRPGPQRPPRAPDRRALVSPPVVHRAPAAHPAAGSRRTRPAGRARWATAEAASTSSSTPRSSTGSCYAWTARARRSSCPDETAATIARRASTAPRAARFWRCPTIRLNQVNWYALMYAADATVTGDPALLRARPARCSSRASSRRAGRAGAATSAPACASTTSRTSRAQRPHERRLGRVREHRAERSRASTTRRGAPGWRRCRAPAAALIARSGSSARSPATGPTPAT